MMVVVSEDWRRTFPGAHLGVLAMVVAAGPAGQGNLAAGKQALEESLRRQYAGFDKAAFRRLPVIQAYEGYYRRWEKSYHVLAQVESVAIKGKSIPAVDALVTAMFMAELKNMLLTAGHDRARLTAPLTLGVASGSESYQGIRGREEVTKAGDMMITDGQGAISSVLHGPDWRTRITDATTDVLFTIYAPAGVGETAVLGHLRDIEAYVRLAAPAAATEEMTVL